MRMRDGLASGVAVREQFELLGLVLGHRGERLIHVGISSRILEDAPFDEMQPQQQVQRTGRLRHEVPSETRVERPDRLDPPSRTPVGPAIFPYPAGVVGGGPFGIPSGAAKSNVTRHTRKTPSAGRPPPPGWSASGRP